MIDIPTAVGSRVPRVEDRRLLRGEGRFVDDVDRPGQLWMRVVRSSLAHARLSGVDCERARQAPGVRAVLGASDLPSVPRIPLRLGQSDPPLDPYLQPVLADGRVRYVGEPVAVVVAEDAYLAEDAAELVRVDYDAMPPLMDVGTSDEVEGEAESDGRLRTAARVRRRHGDVGAAFAVADHVVELELAVGRHSAVPLETRGLVADHDPVTDRLTLWGLTKVAHFNRMALAQMLGISERQITVRPCDVGGGFGVRGEFYPEDFLVPYLARLLSRPVKWIEDRSEHLVSANQSREQRRRLVGAFDGDGRILAIRDDVLHDQGAYIRTVGEVVGQVTVSMLPGPYRVPAYEGELQLCMTNKTPCGTFRSPGRFESTFACERLMDRAAWQLGIDALALRRRNLLTSEDMPHRRTLPILGHDIEIDAGDPRALMEQALDAAPYGDWVDDAARARGEGRHAGVGVACFLEKGGGGGFETAAVQVGGDGRIRVSTGGACLGQGVETVLAQVVGDELMVGPDEIEVAVGDTDLVQTGVGSWASRSTIFGGSAAKGAAAKVATRALDVGAGLLGVERDEVVLGGGHVRLRAAPDTAVSFADVAAACDPVSSARRGEPAGLSATHTSTDLGMTYPYGVHIAQVEVDRDTGLVTVQRYFVACEVGRAVNPMMVEGQLAGGAVQGIGGSLMEAFLYDESGEPQSTSFMAYRQPTASEAPPIRTLLSEDFPSSGNPLGVKGCGESGIVAAGAAVASAVDDALGGFSVCELPLTPERVRALAATIEGQRATVISHPTVEQPREP